MGVQYSVYPDLSVVGGCGHYKDDFYGFLGRIRKLVENLNVLSDILPISVSLCKHVTHSPQLTSQWLSSD